VKWLRPEPKLIQKLFLKIFYIDGKVSIDFKKKERLYVSLSTILQVSL